jgi:hypothetical protein
LIERRPSLTRTHFHTTESKQPESVKTRFTTNG